MREMTSGDRIAIVVGRPIPVSIYSADHTLLLAAGRIVPNEFVRDGLIRSGAYCGDEDGAIEKPIAAPTETHVSDAIAALQADYQHTQSRAQVGFRMERDAQEPACTARVIGVSDDGHGLIMSGPLSAGGVPVDVHAGETWTFRAFYAVAAVRFRATIERVATEPFRYFYVSHIVDVDRRNVRQWPRVPTCLWASRSGDPARIIVDLSVGGARVGVDERFHLQHGQSMLLHPLLTLAIGQKTLSLEAVVLNLYGRADDNHPRIVFCGVTFENLIELDRLTLHAFVQEHLCFELDRVWHVLTMAN